ncbi:MAG: isochorismatase family protein [Polynucleobacter sp.]
MQLNPNTSTLIFIDLQERLMPSIDEGQEVLAQCIRIAKIAQLLQVPMIGTEQSPQSLGSNLAEIAQFCETTFSKIHFNACLDGLIEILPKGRKHLILAGCETHVCLLQTALHLVDESFHVSIIVDAVGSRKPLDKITALKRLSVTGATLVTVEMLAFEWLKSANHSSFKEVLRLIKD